MFQSKSTDREFKSLLQALCDDQLGHEQAQRLEAILESNHDAQQHYNEVVALDTSLRYWSGVEGRLQPRTSDRSPFARDSSYTGRFQRYFRPVAICAAAAICLALGALIVQSTLDDHAQFGDSPRELSVSPLTGEMAVAGRVAKFTPDSQWKSTNLAIMRGTYVRPGQILELKRGVAEIQFAGGAVAVLEGPARFQVQSDSEAFLQFGKLAIRVPPDCTAITLFTPSSRMGLTSGEVGTTVDEQGVTEVQVFSGSLSAGLVTDNGSVIHQCSLSAGSGRRFDTSTELVSKIGFTRYGFIRSVQESYIAYQNFLGSIGNQAFEGSLGMDFVVKDPVEVTKLGVFDSEADGLKRTIRAELWLRDEAGSAYRFDDDSGIERIVEMTFTPDDPGVLVESNRFKPLLMPIILSPGAYTIVASGYGHEEPNGNEGNMVYDRESDQVIVVPAWKEGWKDVGLPIHALKGLDDGGAAILFVGSARWDEVVGQFPRVVDSGAVNRFQAGSFEFHRIDSRKSSQGSTRPADPSRIPANARKNSSI
jgi:hypothetical protein